MSLSEADTRAKLIDPALKEAGWGEEHIRREVSITQGRLYMVGNDTHRRQPLFADYILSLQRLPTAVVEAKDESKHVATGLQQAKAYAEMMDLRFAYSSNGHGFVEFDYVENTERVLEMDAFPAPAALTARLQSQGALPAAGDPLLYPYNTSMGLHPRYYQDVAVRRVLQGIEAGRDRLLLALATGTGKTYIASQIAWKLYQAKRANRVLFLTDRVFLRDQAYNGFAFFAGPGGDPRYAIEGEMSPHHELYFGMYQSLYAERDGRQLFKHVPPDFFDLVIIDECHRSGFGTWREILDYYEGAVQLGLTATPKRRDNIDTYAYFGEPVYSYSLGQGIEDGFLATYKVHRVATNLNQAGGIDVNDALVAGAELFVPEGADDVKPFYTITEFEQKISLPDWTARICEHLAATLNAGDPMERSIVFCVNMDHALEVRQHLQNAFSHLGFSDYAVRIVSEEPYSAALLEEFRDPYRKSPVVATTVDLLSTGVDIPSVRNIVFIKPVGSVVVFKQIVGRGTRLDPVTGKTWFRILDYTGASRLFDEWDRPLSDSGEELPPKPWTGIIRLEAIDALTAERVPGAWGIAVAAPNEQVQFVPEGDELVARGLPELTLAVHVGAPNYNTRAVRLTAAAEEEAELAVVELRPIREQAQRVLLKGVEVEIANEVILTIDATGQQMTVPEYLAYTRGALRERIENPSVLRAVWLDADQRKQLVSELEQQGVHLGLVADLEGVHDADGHDVIAYVAFDQPLVRRAERTESFVNHNANWLAQQPAERAIILELVDAYRDGGIDQLTRQILKLDRFQQHGGAVGVIKALGGSAALDALLVELQERLYPTPAEEAA